MENKEDCYSPQRTEGVQKLNDSYLQSLNKAFKSADSLHKSLQADLFPPSGSLIRVSHQAERVNGLPPEVSEMDDSMFKRPRNINELADQELLTTL